MISKLRTLALRPAPWLACLLAMGWSGQAGAEDQAPAEVPSAAQIEQVVRDYLMREPEVIYEALQELQRRQAAAAAEQQKQAVIANRDQLLRDPESPVGGNPDGDVTLVEFFDYRCQYCRRVVPAMRALLDEDPEIRVVFKELPVLGPDSVRAARAALASRAQDRYLPFHFALMEADDLSEAGLLALAEQVGLDPDRLAEDMQSPAIDQAIEANYALASELGIEGTPAFVIGDRLIPGAIGKTQLEEMIEQERTS